jgi:hypothetical protein
MNFVARVFEWLCGSSSVPLVSPKEIEIAECKPNVPDALLQLPQYAKTWSLNDEKR